MHKGPVVLLAVLALLAGLVPAAFASAPSPTNHQQAYGRDIVTIEQVNMCAWGEQYYDPGPGFPRTCYPNQYKRTSPSWRQRELDLAAAKRTSLVHQIDNHRPDIVTVNEGCVNDLNRVAKTVGYHVVFGATGRGKHPCSVGRGASVNAVLARTITSKAGGGYFTGTGTTAAGKTVPSYRSYVCVNVRAASWKTLRVCTTHLSLASQAKGLQAKECAQLRSALTATSLPTLFAGDVNMGRGNKGNCAPKGFHGLKDTFTKASEDKAHEGGIQQIYYSSGFWRQSCGWTYAVADTDHRGFLLELGKHAPASYATCNRNIT